MIPTRPDLKAIRERYEALLVDGWMNAYAQRLALAESSDDVAILLAHIDALEESLRAAIERCMCRLTPSPSFYAIESPCPSCRAALALLDGRDDE